MIYHFAAELYMRTKYPQYKVRLIDCDTLDNGSEVYVFTVERGISRFKSTLTMSGKNIDEVIA